MQSAEVRTELANIMLAFLEVAVHTVLHARSLYPVAAFERRHAFGGSTYMCRHPGVVEGITQLLKALHAPLVAGSVRAVVLVLTEKGGRALEQYEFEVGNADAAVPRSHAELESMLSSTIARLSTWQSTKPTAKDGSWTVLVRSREGEEGGGGGSGGGAGAGAGGSGLLGPDTPWLRVDSAADPAAQIALAPRAGTWSPLKSVRAGVFALEVWHEEKAEGSGMRRPLTDVNQHAQV
jgi:hypothetical protein